MNISLWFVVTRRTEAYIFNEMLSYNEQLNNPIWKDKSLLIMYRDNFTCYLCGYHGNKLNVHHLKYLPNLMAWEYPDELLFTVCYSCHKTIHNQLIIEKQIESTKIGSIISKNFK